MKTSQGDCFLRKASSANETESPKTDCRRFAAGRKKSITAQEKLAVSLSPSLPLGSTFLSASTDQILPSWPLRTLRHDPPPSTLQILTVLSALPDMTSGRRSLTQWTSSSCPKSRTNGLVSEWSFDADLFRSQMSGGSYFGFHNHNVHPFGQ